MPYKILEHTGDVRIEVSGKNLEEVFSSALEGMISVLKPVYGKKEKEVIHTLDISSSDPTALLIEFLNSVLLEIYSQKVGFESVIFEKLSDIDLKAKITGYHFEELEDDIKAVTYHEADVHKNEQGEFQTRIVFDI